MAAVAEFIFNTSGATDQTREKERKETGKSAGRSTFYA